MTLLETRGLSRSFGGLQALNNLDLTLDSGETLGIIGPNGAGKTTLFNAIAGTIAADAGSVIFEGVDITRFGPERRAELGLIRTFQHGRPFANLSARDNLMLGAHRHRLASRAGAWGAVVELAEALLPLGSLGREEAALKAEADEIAGRFGDRLSPRLDMAAYGFSYANRRRLEIARALASHPTVLLLDEPTAGMNPNETLEMLEFLKTLKARGLPMIIIEHKLPLIMGICDSVIVMDDGLKIAEDHPTRIALHPTVIEAYLGPSHAKPAQPHAEDPHDNEPTDTPVY